MTYTLSSANETVTFNCDQIDDNDRDFGFVWIHRCPANGWFGNSMPKQYMVRDARRMYAELLKAGYVAA